jgi:hypothetical protein
MRFLLFIKNIIHVLKVIYNYKTFNKKYSHNIKNSKGIIFIEFNSFISVHPFLSLLANFFSEKFNYEIKCYDNYILTTKDFDISFFNKIKSIIGEKFNLKTWGIYRSFGVTEFIRPHRLKIDIDTENFLSNIFSNLKTKSDIFKIKYKNILIGDLIYDGYLKFFNAYTIELNDSVFKNYVKDFILLARFWDEYFLKNNVKFIVGCHPYYSYGLIFRIGLLHGINCYYCIAGKIYYLTSNRIFGNLHYLDYKNDYSNIPNNQKEAALLEAKKSLEARFSGKLGSIIKDIVPTRSAYHSNYRINKKFLNKNKKINILISTHQLGDCYYAYGANLFPDFFVWLMFLSKISEVTDYDWYIKDHPPYDKLKIIKSFNRTYELSKNLCRNNKRFTYLDPSTSHHQIINEGINFVLTIYGSVAFEYAYQGIPVLTASNNCSTRPYNFNIHSVSIQDYEDKLKKLSQLNFKIDKKKVLEYFFMHQIYNDSDCLMEEYTSFLDNNKILDDYDTWKFYEFWLNKVNYHKIVIMKKILEKFYDSKDYTLNLSHNLDRLNKILLNS